MVVGITLTRATGAGNNRGCIFAVGILVGDFLRCDAVGISGYINLKDNQESYRQ